MKSHSRPVSTDEPALAEDLLITGRILHGPPVLDLLLDIPVNDLPVELLDKLRIKTCLIGPLPPLSQHDSPHLQFIRLVSQRYQALPVR